MKTRESRFSRLLGIPHVGTGVLIVPRLEAVLAFCQTFPEDVSCNYLQMNDSTVPRPGGGGGTAGLVLITLANSWLGSRKVGSGIPRHGNRVAGPLWTLIAGTIRQWTAEKSR